ncbi:MAG TPA: DUF1499 domain-containing protein [Acetobacteraceae bacterium]|nr:DUF1499 domain-containing protein [Acetobacteraceae bacterium]
MTDVTACHFRMSLLAWLVGLLLPACAATGAHGIPQPPLQDISRLERPASPNTALAAPAGFLPRPDIVTPVYKLAAGRLLAAVEQVAQAQPRTFLAADYRQALQMHWVVRSAVFNFPDLIMAQVIPHGAGHSELLLYSRSLYGYGDFGVNRRRLTVWLAALDVRGRPSVESASPR